MRHFTRNLGTAVARRAGKVCAGLIGALLLAPCPTASAQCASLLEDGGFESQQKNAVSRPWFAEGRTGVDRGLRLSHGGSNNAWARHNAGWNALRQRVRLEAGKTYTLKGFVRSSGNVRDGYFGFRDEAQRPVAEIKYGPLPGYRELRVQFRPARAGAYNVFAGFWAPNQDAWIQIDDLRIDFACEDVVLNPVSD